MWIHPKEGSIEPSANGRPTPGSPPQPTRVPWHPEPQAASVCVAGVLGPLHSPPQPHEPPWHHNLRRRSRQLRCRGCHASTADAARPRLRPPDRARGVGDACISAAATSRSVGQRLGDRTPRSHGRTPWGECATCRFAAPALGPVQQRPVIPRGWTRGAPGPSRAAPARQGGQHVAGVHVAVTEHHPIDAGR